LQLKTIAAATGVGHGHAQNTGGGAHLKSSSSMDESNKTKDNKTG